MKLHFCLNLFWQSCKFPKRMIIFMVIITISRQIFLHLIKYCHEANQNQSNFALGIVYLIKLRNLMQFQNGLCFFHIIMFPFSSTSIIEINLQDMCICSSKYGSPFSYLLSPETQKAFANNLPIQIQKRDDLRKKKAIDVHPVLDKTAATIFTKGKIYTMNEKQKTVEAVAVSGGRILFAGAEADAMKFKDAHTQIVDLGHRVMLPGFIDPHIHMMFSLLDHWLDLGPFVHDHMDKVKLSLIQAIKKHTNPKYLLSAQLFDPQITPGQFDVSRKGLDALSETVPIFILQGNGHVAHVNSAAFKLAKIDKNTPDPDHGRFIRDENGELTGEVQQTAVGLFRQHFSPVQGEDYIKNFKKFLHTCASKGCTSLHDCSIGNGTPQGDLAVLYQVFNQSAPVRFSGYLISTAWDIWQKLKLVPDYKDEELRINGIKCWVDGSTQAGSAYLRDPYLVSQWGRGSPNYTPEALQKSIRLAHNDGWQVGVHANGDAGIDMALDAFQSVQKSNPNFKLRHRTEHTTICHEEQLAKMKDLQISPSFLIGHIYYYGEVFERVLGEERAFRTDPLKSAFKHGLTPTIHSDYNCQPVDPLRCIYNAVTRRVLSTKKVLNEDECVSPYQAVQAMTINAAWQCHMEDIVGSIEEKKMADFVILERDPMAIDPEEIIGIKIHETWMNGKVTYKAKL